MWSRRPTGSASPPPARRDASLALGTNEVNLLELVVGLCALRQWRHRRAGPTASPKSATARGKIVFRRSGSGPGQVVAPSWSATMNQMLSGVIEHGTGRSAALRRPAAGKTGTTQEYRDAWFIGYTADLVAGVWLGNDDNTPMNKVTGGSLPAQLAQFHADRDPRHAGAAAAERPGPRPAQVRRRGRRLGARPAARLAYWRGDTQAQEVVGSVPVGDGRDAVRYPARHRIIEWNGSGATRLCGQAALLQQRRDCRLAAAESAIQLHRVGGVAGAVDRLKPRRQARARTDRRPR